MGVRVPSVTLRTGNQTAVTKTMATERPADTEAEEKVSLDPASSSKLSPDGVPVNQAIDPVLTGNKQNHLASWDGSKDPDDPRNWNFGARLYGVFVPAWYAFAT